MNTSDIKLQLRKELNTKLQAEYSDYTVYLDTTNETDNFITMVVEIFDQSYNRIVGQVTCNLAFSDPVERLAIEDLVINSLHNYTYATADSSASLELSFTNDLSNYAEAKHQKEIIFEFLGY